MDCDDGPYKILAGLHPGNQAALSVWLHVQTQWRAGGLGVIGIDMAEVRRTARELGLRWSYALRSKITALEQAVLKKANSSGD